MTQLQITKSTQGKIRHKYDFRMKHKKRLEQKIRMVFTWNMIRNKKDYRFKSGKILHTEKITKSNLEIRNL